MTVDAFRRNYLVVGLTEEQIEKVFSMATVRGHLAGETIVTHGQTENELFVVLKGRVNVLTPDGDKLAEVGPGGVVGEIQLIDSRPRTANVVCVGLVDVAVIPTRELRALMNQDRNLGFVLLANLAQVLCARLRDADMRIDALAFNANGGVWNNAL